MNTRPKVLSTVATTAAAVIALGTSGCASSHDLASGPKRPAPRPTTTVANRHPSKHVTVYETMFDIGYRPNAPLSFPRDTTVRFVFHNIGTNHHEAVLGDEATQLAHDREMAGLGTPTGIAPPELDVAPGATASLTYTFRVAGKLVIGCHYPNHYAGGMRIPITITP